MDGRSLVVSPMKVNFAIFWPQFHRNEVFGRCDDFLWARYYEAILGVAPTSCTCGFDRLDGTFDVG
jgi:hypothetical protein